MPNVCAHLGCTKWPRYGCEAGQDGRGSPLFCAPHSEEGMVSLLAKKKCTRQGGCTRHPNCGTEGTKTTQLHAPRAEEGVVRLRDNNCNNLQGKHPSFAVDGSRIPFPVLATQFCNPHAKHGMVQIYGNKRCKRQGCDKYPSYGVQGTKAAQFCGLHAEEEMVCVLKMKRFARRGCTKYPNHSEVVRSRSKRAKFCASHPEEGMVDTRHKKCIHQGCNEISSCCMEASKTAQPCASTLAEEGMINVYNKKRCADQGCTNQARFAVKSTNTTELCVRHLEEGMVQASGKSCTHQQGCPAWSSCLNDEERNHTFRKSFARRNEEVIVRVVDSSRALPIDNEDNYQRGCVTSAAIETACGNGTVTKRGRLTSPPSQLGEAPASGSRRGSAAALQEAATIPATSPPVQWTAPHQTADVTQAIGAYSLPDVAVKTEMAKDASFQPDVAVKTEIVISRYAMWGASKSKPNAWNALVNTTRTNDFVDVGGGTNESGSDADNGLGSNPEDRKFHAQTDRGSDDGNPLDAAQQSTENSASLTSSAVGGKPFEGGGAQTAGRKKLRRKIANKSYIEWSCILLREVSRKRGLRVTCRESDKAKMARMLTNQDTVLQRSSPFIADIGGDSGADGVGDGGKGASSIPAGAIQMMLAAMEFGTRFDFEREPDRMFVFEGSEYRCADVKSALDAGTPANLPKRIRRKTPHCLARLVHLIADENFRVTFLRSHLPASRAELGEDKASADRDRDVWQDLLTAFVDSNYKLQSKLGDDPRVMHVNPNIVGQPNITVEKLKQMYSSTKNLYNKALDNFKQPGHSSPFWEFCRGSTDVYVFRKVVEGGNHMENFMDALQPDKARMECVRARAADGAIQAGGSAAETVKRKDITKPRAGGTYANRKKNANRRQAANRILKADLFMKQCLYSIGAMLARTRGTGGGEENLPSRVQELARLEISAKRMKMYKRHEEDLAQEKAKGDEADAVLVNHLEHRILLLVAKLNKGKQC